MLSIVHLPSSAAEAAELLRDGGWVVGGGTVVMPRVNTAAVPVGQLVCLGRAGLAGIHVDGRSVSVGATTTLAALGADSRLRFLGTVVRSIASPPVRNLATVGGNLLVEQPHGDLAVALLALDARVDVVHGGGTRQVGIEDLRAGPAEIVSTVHFSQPSVGTWFYRKAMRRRFNSAAIVTVAAVIAVEDGLVRRARIALGGVAARPLRARAAEATLLDAPFDRPTIEAAAEVAREGIEPIEDAYASAWYRRRVLPVHVRRTLLGED